MTEASGLLDLHCHILPGVDDGAVDMADALEMARAALAQGCRAVCATSHLWEGLFDTSPELNAAEHAALVAALRRERLELEVFPGAENYLGPGPAERETDRFVALGPAGRWVLFDFSMHEALPDVSGAIDALARRGFGAVVAHPERNAEIQADPTPVADWIERGGVIQVNAPSLLGRMGREAKLTGEYLMDHEAVHVLASDAHSQRRPFCLGETHELVTGRWGRDTADRLCRDHPWRIARGEAVATSPVRLEPRSRAARFLKRFGM